MAMFHFCAGVSADRTAAVITCRPLPISGLLQNRKSIF